jgi:hypothetical protein
MKIDSRRRIAALSLAGTIALMGFGVGVVSAAGPSGATGETGIEATASETENTGIEADAPGGHADAPGVDVNHEFNGEE